MKRILLLVVVPLIALLAGAIFYLMGGRYQDTDNAYVQADVLQVSPQISGLAQSIAVSTNEQVKAGQILVTLDQAQYKIAVAKAEAALAQVKIDYAATIMSDKEIDAQITEAKTKQGYAKKALDRQGELVARNVAPAAGYDDVMQTNDLAEQQIALLRVQKEKIAQSLGGSIDTPVEDTPNYKSALAQLDQAKLYLAQTELKSPVDGVVSKLPKQGEYLTAGYVALVVVKDQDMWLDANYTEAEITNIKPGQPATITIDTFPDTTWKGEVASISPATGAEFSIIPAQNATGNWVKIAQRVTVRIKINPEQGQPPLRAGLSANVSVDTGHKRHLLGLTLQGK